MSKWYEFPKVLPKQSNTNRSRIPSFAELIRSCGTKDDSISNKAAGPHFEAHYRVKILPKESCVSCLKSNRQYVPQLMGPARPQAFGKSIEDSSDITNKEFNQLVQNYISETKKLIFEFNRFEDGFRDGSFPRTLPEDSIDQLASVHENASKTLLHIRKSYHKSARYPERTLLTASVKRDKTSRIAKPRSAGARKTDHSVIAFTIKAAKPQTSMMSNLRPSQDYLNKDLCLKSNTVCTQCGSTQTPEWRSGPSGSRTLCNACGLFYSKLVKKMGVADACDCLKKRKRTVIPDSV